MGSSLKEGIKAIQEKGGPDSAIVMVCDQPFVTAAHLRSLWETYRKSKVKAITSAYAGTYGVPALFSPDLYDHILTLADDQGAKKLIQQFPRQVTTVEFPNGSFDLDTEEDYQNFLNQSKKATR